MLPMFFQSDFKQVLIQGMSNLRSTGVLAATTCQVMGQDGNRTCKLQSSDNTKKRHTSTTDDGDFVDLRTSTPLDSLHRQSHFTDTVTALI